MNTKHTKGNWFVRGGIGLDGKPNIIIASSIGHSVATTGHISQQSKANAQFIAAAPELLEALIQCKKAVEDQSLPASARLELVRDIATPIIYKATK